MSLPALRQVVLAALVLALAAVVVAVDETGGHEPAAQVHKLIFGRRTTARPNVPVLLPSMTISTGPALGLASWPRSAWQSNSVLVMTDVGNGELRAFTQRLRQRSMETRSF